MAESELAVLEPQATEQAEVEPEGDTSIPADASETDAEEEANTEETLTPEQAKALAAEEVRKALQERKAEDDRQAQEQNYKRTLEWSARVLNESAEQRLEGVVNWLLERVEAGDSTEQVRRNLSRQAIKAIATELGGAAFFSEMDLISGSFRSFVAKQYPDWRPSAELTRELENAQRALPGDQPGQQAQRRVDAEWKYMQTAVREAELPKAREEWAKEAEKDNKNASKVKELAKGSNGANPVRGGGGGTANRSFQTMLAADTAFAKGEISSAVAREYRAKYMAGQIPYQ